MEQDPFNDYNETASTRISGGCFSLLIIPFVTILLITSWLRFLHGGSGSQLSLQIKINEIPASAHSDPSPTAEIAATPQPEAGIASFFAPSVQFWEQEILLWAEQAELDPNLIATVMQIESCGDPRALSHVGAMGLFQVMPYHFEENEAPYNPQVNAARGIAYLSKSLQTHGSIRLALAGYNGGIGTASKSEAQWPLETIRYAYWGTGIYNEANQDQPFSDRLEEWYQAGGASLCRQAEDRLGITP